MGHATGVMGTDGPEALAERLAAARIAGGLSARQVSRRAGLKTATHYTLAIKRMREGGELERPTYQKIASALAEWDPSLGVIDATGTVRATVKVDGRSSTLLAEPAIYRVADGGVGFRVQRAALLKVREKLLERFPRDAVNEVVARSAFVDADERDEVEMYLHFEEMLLATRPEQKVQLPSSDSANDDEDQDSDDEAQPIDSKTDSSPEALEIEKEILARERAKRA